MRGPRRAHRSRSASPDFLLRLVALANFMRLSLRERRTRERVQRSAAGNPGRDDKKERAAGKRGPLPKDRTVVGTVGTSTAALFLYEIKKVTTSRDDNGKGDSLMESGCRGKGPKGLGFEMEFSHTL